MSAASRSSSAAPRQGAPAPPGGPPHRRRTLASLGESVLLRAGAYYVALFAAIAGVWRLLPDGARRDAMATFAPMLGSTSAFADAPFGVTAGAGAGGAAAQAALAGSREPVAIVVAVAAAGAFLLALPVAWVYMFTHHRKGYRQSAVHTLVLLPVVVAGIVVMVKSSLALAFALAGIVAAVRFRTTLDDSKDAVYLFLVTGLGLAAGVELDVAVALSLTFNVAVLLLWYTDFARTPPRLEGVRAQRQMERALALANRTSQFVARVDREIVQAMAPEQLDALAERVGRRRAETGGDLPPTANRRFDARLRVVTTDATAVRDLIEPAIDANVKRWRCRGTRAPSAAGAPDAVVEYDVRWRRDAPPGVVLDAVRGRGGALVVAVSVERGEVPAGGGAANGVTP